MNWLFQGIASLLILLRDGIGTFLDPDSGLTWALAIISLVLLTRLILLPLWVKNFHEQRVMQKARPDTQKLTEAAKERINRLRKSVEFQSFSRWEKSQAIMKEQKRLTLETQAVAQTHGSNSIWLIVPVIIQILVGIGIFHVTGEFRLGATASYGISAEDFASAANASVFGAPLAATLTMTTSGIASLGGDPTIARLGGGLLLLISMFATGLAIRQSTSRIDIVEEDMVMPSDGADMSSIMRYQMAQMTVYMKKYGWFGVPILTGFVYIAFPIAVLISVSVLAVWITVAQKIMYSRHPALTPEEISGDVLTPKEQALVNAEKKQAAKTLRLEKQRELRQKGKR